MNEVVFTVYVLYSAKFDKHYTGYTTDLLNRFRGHNHFEKGWTARYRPWMVIYTEVYCVKSEAMGRERWLKSGVGRDFVRSLDVY